MTLCVVAYDIVLCFVLCFASDCMVLFSGSYYTVWWLVLYNFVYL